MACADWADDGGKKKEMEVGAASESSKRSAAKNVLSAASYLTA